MTEREIGFIGGGRITEIFLRRFNYAGMHFGKICVSDPSAEILNNLKSKFPAAEVYQDGNKKVSECGIVFISLHPPVMTAVLEEIKDSFNKDAVIVSLAPKVGSDKIRQTLGDSVKIVRMIPNSPSAVGKGFNPVWYSDTVTAEDKKDLCGLFSLLGEAPETDEKNLEAYAVTSAMGPTYFQFQMEQLKQTACEFGLAENKAKEAVYKMLAGALALWNNSEYSFQEVYNMIPVKPFGEDEEKIKNIYREKLPAIFNKIQPQ